MSKTEHIKIKMHKHSKLESAINFIAQIQYSPDKMKNAEIPLQALPLGVSS